MTEVRPFRGLRFQEDVVGDIGGVLCPPYDVISPEEQRELYRRSPFNVIRLEYGEANAADTATDNRYTRAAAALNDWLGSGVLARDGTPALYVHDQEFAHQGQRLTRRGLFARVRLHDWVEGVILPHEHTMSSPKEDRLRLLRACRVNVSPVLALYRDPAGDVRGVLEGARDRSPLLEATDGGGQRHRLYAITDRHALDGVGGLFREKNVYIIDGHHRYETALAYRDERRSQARSWSGEEGENFALLTLVASEDAGLVVLPTHRLLKGASLPPDFVPRLKRAFRVQDVSREVGGESAWRRLETLLAEAGRDGIAIGVVGERGNLCLIITVTDSAEVSGLMPADSPESWRLLDAAILQELVLRDILGVDQGSDERMAFTDDGAEALRLVESGRCAVAFFLNATLVDRVLEVADAGERMPQKSTYFYPKLPTGLVMNPLD